MGPFLLLGNNRYICYMLNQPNLASRIWSFYRDGFRNMTWGRPLVWLIVLYLMASINILRIVGFAKPHGRLRMCGCYSKIP